MYFDQVLIGRRDLSFVPSLLLSILTRLFLPSSSVSSCYLIIAVPMRECLGKHSWMSSPFPIAILNGYTFLIAKRQDRNCRSVACQKLTVIIINNTKINSAISTSGSWCDGRWRCWCWAISWSPCSNSGWSQASKTPWNLSRYISYLSFSCCCLSHVWERVWSNVFAVFVCTFPSYKNNLQDDAFQNLQESEQRERWRLLDLLLRPLDAGIGCTLFFFFWNKITKNTIVAVIKIQTAWLIGWQVIW